MHCRSLILLTVLTIFCFLNLTLAEPVQVQALPEPQAAKATKIQRSSQEQLQQQAQPANVNIPRRDPGEGDPIEINDIEELQRIGNDENYPLNGVYILADDIDASETAEWNDGAGFEPIGDRDHPFTGSFNGDGHIIRGLFINRPRENDVGLFGRTGDEAVIENVGLIDVEVNGGDYNVGGLVGYNYQSTISNSYVTGDVSSAWGSYVGGLVGMNSEVTISNCYIIGRVSGAERVGGLVGGNWRNSVISNSYATGNIHGEEETGGLVGYNDGSTISNSYATGRVYAFGAGGICLGGLVGYGVRSTIANSYATGNVSGSRYVGGLVGYNGFRSSISDSYANGRVRGAWDVGGLVGNSSQVPAENYRNNYWDTETTGRDNGIGNMDDIDGVRGQTTAELMNQDTFEDWDFEETWFMPGAEQDELSFPHLQMEEAVHNHRFIAQDLDLSLGWNMISFNTEPDLRGMGYLFRDVEGLILIKDERGNLINRQNNIDDIGDMSIEEGYQVKTSEASRLHIFGKAPQLPFKVHLNHGWNIMGYPLTESRPAREVFQPLIDSDINILAKNYLGRFIVHLEGNDNRGPIDFDNLGDLEPGQGYQIRVSQETDLILDSQEE